MSLIIDAIIILVIAIFTFIGYHQGLIKSAIKILSFFVAIIIAVMLYKPLATFVIDHTDIDEKNKDQLQQKYYQKV